MIAVVMNRRASRRALSTVLAAALAMLLFPLMGVGQTLPAQSFPRPQLQPQAPGPLDQAMPVRPDYMLGANDQILLRVPGVTELNDQPFRINAEGFVELPIVGRVRAAGLTIQNLERELVTRLREFIREPQVFISLVQFRSEPVFFVGYFRVPGVYPLQGSRTLVEMLSAVGGILPNASRKIRIIRRSEYGSIPLPQAVENPERRTSTVDISLESLTQNVNPEEDIVLQPYDIVSAEVAERVYVTGEVTRGASIELGQRNSISLAQALTEVGGFTPFAGIEKVTILRPIIGTNRRAEIVVDLRDVLSGRRGDFPLLANDVLYVPRSTSRTVMAAMIPGLIGAVPYIIVSAFFR